MNELTHLFSALLSMSLTALPVMAVVLAARFLLRSAPKKYSYLLWAVVGFRLACPISLAQPWSLFNLRPLRNAAEAVSAVSGGFSAVSPSLPPVATLPTQAPGAGTAAGTTALSGGELALKIAAVVWLAGLALLLFYGVWAYLRLRRTVATAVLRETNLYECDAISSPFVLGFFHPRIYIPFHLDDNQRTYVLCHERTHIRRRDYLVKPLAFGLLAVYWWNPAVWLCYFLCCRDMEMSCDEAVLSTLGVQAKGGYGMALVDFATEKKFPAALAFGELDAKNRVKHVLNWKKVSAPAAFLSLCAVALVGMVCLSNATAEQESWVKVEGSAFRPTITVQLADSVRSWALYEDVYKEGTLLSSRSCILAGFPGDPPLTRRFSATLQAVVSSDGADGFAGKLDCSWNNGGTNITWTTPLPKAHYTGAGSFLGPETGDSAQRQYLGENGDALLMTQVFSTKPSGGTVLFEKGVGVVAANDTVVQYRLMTSTQTADTLPPATSPADALYALRTPYVGDAPAMGKLLEALEVGKLGAYSVELFTAKAPLTLQVNFKDIPADIDPTSPKIDRAMNRNAALLLALVGNLEQVNWSYPSREDGQKILYTNYASIEQTDAWVKSAGNTGVKAAGSRAVTFRALWESLPVTAPAETTLQYRLPVENLPAASGRGVEYACDFGENVEGYTLQELVYQRGKLVSNQTRSAAAVITRQGTISLRYAPNPAAGGWDAIDWRFGLEKQEAFTTVLPKEAYSDGRMETVFGERTPDAPLAIGENTVLFAAFYGSGGGIHPLPCEDLNDPARLAACVGDNDVVVLLRLTLWPDAQIPGELPAPETVSAEAWWTAYLSLRDNNGFLCSEYERPQDADLAEIFYTGAGLPDASNLTAELKAAYEKAVGLEIQTDMTWVDGAMADAFLQNKCGTALKYHLKGLQHWTYLPESDVYLFQHGDTHYRLITVLKAIQTKDTATVTYTREDAPETWTVTLNRVDGRWNFVSNLPK